MSFLKNELKVSMNISMVEFRFNPDVSKWNIKVNGSTMCHFNSFLGAYKKSYFENLTSAVDNAEAMGVLPKNFNVEDLPLPKVIVK